MTAWKYRILPVCWCVLTALTLLADYVTGPEIQFPLIYLVCIYFAARYSGLGWAVFFAVSMAAARTTFEVIWGDYALSYPTMINGLTLLIVLNLVAVLVHRTTAQQAELSREVKTLKGLLPICSFCKRIRGGDNSWQGIEQYFSSNSAAQFIHSICPECMKEHYGDLTE
jgi:hypothetical protein